MKKKLYPHHLSIGVKQISAPISEIFFSYQGEGARIGEPEIFVRLAGCNLNCNYCDTPLSRTSASAKITSLKDTLKKIFFIKKKHPQTKTISITGGEPLLYPEFIYQLVSHLKKTSLNILLETNATRLPPQLKKIIAQTDFVSADLKLPSTLNNLRQNLKAIQSSFLKKIPPHKLYIKIPITSTVTEKEFADALNLIKANTPPTVPIFIQPVTPTARNRGAAPHPLTIFKLNLLAHKILGLRRQIHITPQMHKLLWDIR